MNRPPMRNVTMIDDLPDVDQLVDQQDNERFGYGSPDEKLQKFIRPPHKIAPDAGMAPYGGPPPRMDMPPPPPRMDMPPPRELLPPQPLNCVDVANHIQNCPICSKFYKNDNTIYIILIVLLSVMCLLLLKRVLNV
jgi:hypothetical protein